MINKKTVLILGAGASRPYGFPLGKELKEEVCIQLNKVQSNEFKIILELGIKDTDIHEFRNTLFYSGQSSVDAFLENRSEFLEIGKSAIAVILMKYENQKILFKKGDWYEYLFDKMRAPFEEFNQNNIAIITFNYDRSLEQFLFTSLFNSYGRRESEIVEKIKRIPIIHLYGQLGKLIWQDENGVPFQNKPKIENIRKAVKEIKIIHENMEVQNDINFKNAYLCIREAERIYFLGFGYSQTNINRLIPFPLSVDKPVGGTAIGLKTAQRDEIGSFFVPKNINIKLRPQSDCLHFLMEYVRFQ